MRILRSIVVPSTAFMTFCDPKMTGCSSIGSEIICDELVWDKAIFLQQLAQQFERRPFVSPGLDQNVEHFTLGLHGTPRMDHPAIDFQIESSGPGELHPQALTDLAVFWLRWFDNM
jgi:hypothetical protein